MGSVSKKPAPNVTPRMAKIGKRINKARVLAGFTHAQLAERIGITADAVKKIANGESCQKFADLYELARFLKTTPNDLLGFSDTLRASRRRAALAGVLRAFEVDPLEAEELSKIVLAIVEAPPSSSPGGGGRPKSIGSASEEAVRQFLSVFPLKSRPSSSRPS